MLATTARNTSGGHQGLEQGDEGVADGLEGDGQPARLTSDTGAGVPGDQPEHDSEHEADQDLDAERRPLRSAQHENSPRVRDRYSGTNA